MPTADKSGPSSSGGSACSSGTTTSSGGPVVNATSSASKHNISEAIDRFFPLRYREASIGQEEEREALENSLLEKWSALKGKSSYDCVRIFLTCTRKWQFFGAKLFDVQVKEFFFMFEN